jgi:hypothetical protein
MTQTPTEPPQATTRSDSPLHPCDILMNLIVALLAPMFLSVAGGDIAHARMAAIGTVNAYRIRNQADLIAIAQIIGFGLAALGSLSLSMADDISLSMTLRLRGNANALNRSAEHNRRALTASHATDRSLIMPRQPRNLKTNPPRQNHDVDNAELTAGMAAANNAVADGQEPLPTEQQPANQAPTPAPAPAADVAAAQKTNAAQDTAAPAQTTGAATQKTNAMAEKAAEKRHHEMWAIAMVKEASEITASIPSLPQAERRAATIRAAVLGSTANELLTGASSPSPIHRNHGTPGRPNTI